jgi:hypothetical protein
VLRALRQLLRPGGRTAFTTITVAPGLDGRARRRAREAGPRAVASRSDHRQLLRAAGYVDIAEIDVTGAFIETMRRWIETREHWSEHLASLDVPGAFEERQRDQRAGLAATEQGLLRRTILSASRPRSRGDHHAAH